MQLSPLRIAGDQRQRRRRIGATPKDAVERQLRQQDASPAHDALINAR
jgi:hypothetical protein